MLFCNYFVLFFFIKKAQFTPLMMIQISKFFLHFLKIIINKKKILFEKILGKK